MRYSPYSVPNHHSRLPRTMRRVYQVAMQPCVADERLGCDTAFVAEHHIREYIAMPNPAPFLEALAPGTTRRRHAG